MYFDEHEGKYYFYNEKDFLIANYSNYLELIDVERMLTLNEMEFITEVLANNL